MWAERKPRPAADMCRRATSGRIRAGRAGPLRRPGLGAAARGRETPVGDHHAIAARDFPAVTPSPNHYQLLGLDADATDERRSGGPYRARAKTAHPDAGGDPAAFRQLLVAYETLIRPDRRRDYDDRSASASCRRGVPDGGKRDAGWEGRQGEFSGDVSFPAWMRGITDEQWIPAPPDEESLADPEQVAAERAAAADRPPPERRADVVWWWPHRRGRATRSSIGDHLVVGGARPSSTLDAATGTRSGACRSTARSWPHRPVIDDRRSCWTDDGEVHGVDRTDGRTRWSPTRSARCRAGWPRLTPGGPAPSLLATRADARFAALRAGRRSRRGRPSSPRRRPHPPAVDDGLAVVVSGGRTVEAIDPRTGKHRWRIHLRNPVHLPPRILGYSVWLAGGGPAGSLVRLDAATGAVEGTFAGRRRRRRADDRRRSMFATAAGPGRMVVLDELGRVDLAVATQRVCAEPAVTPSFAYLADPSGRILSVDRVRRRVAAALERALRAGRRTGPRRPPPRAHRPRRPPLGHHPPRGAARPRRVLIAPPVGPVTWHESQPVRARPTEDRPGEGRAAPGVTPLASVGMASTSGDESRDGVDADQPRPAAVRRCRTRPSATSSTTWTRSRPDPAGLRDRPLSVIRVHRGQAPFMQKNVPKYAPDWVPTVTLWAEASKRDVAYALCNDRRTLLWFAQPAGDRVPPDAGPRPTDSTTPTHLVLDLDPPEGDAFAMAVRAAHLVAPGARRRRPGRRGEDQRRQGRARVRADRRRRRRWRTRPRRPGPSRRAPSGSTPSWPPRRS